MTGKNGGIRFRMLEIVFAAALLEAFSFPTVAAAQTMDQSQVREKAKSYAAMQTAGMALTISGGALLVTGAGLAVAGAIGVGLSFITFNWDDMTGWAAVYFTGIIFLSVGGAATVTGIPLWIVGAVRKNKYRKMLVSLAPLAGRDPLSRAVVGGLRFSLSYQ
jgi:hypothetical protein